MTEDKELYDLTIAIPTYNRADKLSGAIQSLVEKTRGRNVEIIVSDNASKDNTKEIVNAFVDKGYPIKYYCNKENLGYAGNFISCFNHAKGKYVWLLSDDDILTNGAVDSILECIKRSPEIIKLKTVSTAQTDAIGEACETIEFTDREKFYEAIGILSTFITGIVFKTDNIKAIDKSKYVGNSLILGYVLESLGHEGVYLINNTCCAYATPNEKVSYDVYKVWVYQYAHDFFTIGRKSGFSDMFIEKQVHKDLDKTIFDFVIKFRQSCDSNRWDERCVWEYVNRFPDLRKWYKPAIKMPPSLLPLLAIVHKVCRKVGIK